ncbi:MAG TPA: STAS domain-containing protein [Candidatus Acidoferrales bacterium]|nr:STAS domain-containing protein [Candidatus Acidoferrales bacterium]
MSLQTTTRTFAGVTIVECSGRLVLGQESANLRHLVKDVLTESKQIVLDLGNVRYIDSSGLGILVSLYASAQKLGAGIKLANLSPRLKDMLQITRLLTVFEVFDAAEDAAAVFNPTAGQSKPEEWY